MDDDFDRRMELRRQRREQMKLDAESGTYGTTTDDDEEAARERRRKAREERMKNKEEEDPSSPATDVIDTNSETQTESSSTSEPASSAGGAEDEAVLLDRLAKREERRQRRQKEALERQKEFDPTVATTNGTENHQEQSSEDRESQRDAEKETNSLVEEDSKKEEEPTPEPEEPQKAEEEVAVEEEVTKTEDKQVVEEKPKKPWEKQNGGLHNDSASQQKKPERGVGLGRGSAGSQAAEDKERLEAEQKLEDLKRRRDNADSEEFEKMKQKAQQEASDLEELKKKREERRKVLEEEERQKKQEMAEKKAKEQEERKRMKEEIEQRRKEAAEKKKQMQEEGAVDGKPAFTCVTPKGKIGERAEFLNKSAQKSSTVRPSHTPMVSKIGNRLEQYNTALQGSKEAKSPKSPVGDLPVGGTRNIKNMWEKGNVFGASESPASTNKDAAGIKVGVAGRVNEWAKPPEAGKGAPGSPPPADLKPVDVTNKRGLWETKKSSAAAKVAVGGKGKSLTNAGTGH